MADLERHVESVLQCRRCPGMFPPPVSCGPVRSPILLVGQAPGDKEPVMGRPFAWTAGRTLFRWFESHCHVGEADFRTKVYMAAVCRCFPGKNVKGGDRVPTPQEIDNCSLWLEREFALLQPRLVLAVGKLAIAQFTPVDKLVDIIGLPKRVEKFGRELDMIALPHPSGASTWHRMEPGRTLLAQALGSLAKHPVFREVFATVNPGFSTKS